MPIISVIVPVYKVEPYLHQCVDSILNQTFKDFELILVDDGSPDNCPVICDEYAKKDSRVIVIHKENGGLSSARNAGLDYVFAHSNSEYISFVDSDDYVDSRFLELLYNAIKGNDMSVCSYITFGDNSRNIEVFVPKKCILNKKSYWLINDDDIYRIVAWNKLYKKEIFSNIRYPLGKNNEDEYVIHQIVWQCNSIALIGNQLYHYRLRDGSIMSKEKTALERNKLLLDVYIERMLFYENVNDDFLNYYDKALGKYINLLLSQNYKNNEQYAKIKSVYNQKKKNGYKGSKNEMLLFLFPRLFKILKMVRRNCIDK